MRLQVCIMSKNIRNLQSWAQKQKPSELLKIKKTNHDGLKQLHDVIWIRQKRQNVPSQFKKQQKNIGVYTMLI